MNKAIVIRQHKDKENLLDKLKSTPIIQVACQKAGVGRATYYRWKKKDKKFAKTADEALEEGRSFINDMAESQLLSAIKEKNLSAIYFWLRNHHYSYTTKVEINAKLKMDKETLTAEQESLIKNALDLAGLLTASQKKGKNKNES